ncbi:MAG TPA: sigma-54 dependent transcriptional regulator [Phycisphaerae bacterium]|nr:sigma-54 dependent transcriptional regulator [Phycisphaerae bacterium]HNU44626.1 sigma-54 dependent transcriptional regulator [Phycisphaerae bacterium]
MAATTPKAHVLLVDDDRIILDSLREFLQLEGYAVDVAANLNEALPACQQQVPDLVLTDINMPGGDGFELLHILRKRWPETVVVMMTGYGTIESAVEAIKMGAYDYLTKPIHDDELSLTIERALQQRTLVRENRRLRERLDQRFGLEQVVGQDYRLRKVLDMVETVAESDVTVLLQGPSGTGKSLVAQVIHQRSARRDKPFVEVACGAIPESLLESELFGHVRGAFTGAVANKEGKFKAAHPGTIFLDEIATASPGLQVKLLRVLQSQQFEPLGSNKTETVDLRFVLATNVDLEAEVRAGRFREDLFYRINVVTVDLPPLADRASDIVLLARHFLRQFCERMKRHLLDFEPDALAALQRYSWPGNVRELENAVERAVVLSKGPHVTLADLPPRVFNPGRPTGEPPPYQPKPLREALAEPERRILEAALQANGWNRQLTAEQLGINRTTLYKKMKRYGLLPDALELGAH